MVLFLQCPKQIFWIYLHIKNKLIKFYVEQGILRQFVLGMSFLYDELGSEKPTTLPPNLHIADSKHNLVLVDGS